MNIPFRTQTRLKKSARDNGFDIPERLIDGWMEFSGSHTPLRIWLSTIGESVFLLALSNLPVKEQLRNIGTPWINPLPPEATWALSVNSYTELDTLIRRAFEISRAIPDTPYKEFTKKTENLPQKTEIERTTIERIGQDIFRRSLLAYWNKRCPITGLDIPDLLRASHIKPWAKCPTNKERLDVYNGLLLSPNLDLAFDQGYITITDTGHIQPSPQLDTHNQKILNLSPTTKIPNLLPQHHHYLDYHRTNIFKK